MKKLKTKLEDVYILIPERFGDSRGYFESITERDLQELGFNRVFQVSNSLSNRGILRGLHFQKNPYCQAKAVRCHKGKVLDVIVDLRSDSKTYLQYETVLLTPRNGKVLFVPRGFAHGFIALTNNTLFEYYVDNEYKPEYEDGILWNDKDINIPWDDIFKKYKIEEPILSDKDKKREKLKDKKINFKKEKTKYLITGYKGQLGYDIKRELLDRGETDILALDIEDMDITKEDEVERVITNYKPDVIFHCAAYTAVDKAEDNEDIAYKVNVIGTKNISELSIKVGAKLFYMSTDYVFDGKKDGIYNESDKVFPMSIYGKTKYLGEEYVEKNPKHFITRISWVFGINGNNFIKTMIKLSKTHDELSVVSDQIGSPTYTVDLAKLLVEMSYTEEYGLYNVTNEGFTSWANFAKTIMQKIGSKTKIKEVTTDEYLKNSQNKVAKRPYNSRLSKDKLASVFHKLPTWEDALDRYLNELKKEGKL